MGTAGGWVESTASPSCARATGIEKVWVTPDDVKPSDDALRAIAEAEVIVLGPGSLYTSILPGLMLGRSATRSSPHRRSGCSCATSRRRPARRPATTWPTTSTRSSGHTARPVSSTSSSPTVTSARPPPTAALASPVALRWPPAGPIVPRLVLDDVVDPAGAALPRPDPAGRRPPPDRRARGQAPAGVAGVARDRVSRARSRPRRRRSGAELAAADATAAVRPTRAARLASVRRRADRDAVTGPPRDPTRPRRRQEPTPTPPSAVRLDRPREIIAGSPSCVASSSATAR